MRRSLTCMIVRPFEGDYNDEVLTFFAKLAANKLTTHKRKPRYITGRRYGGYLFKNGTMNGSIGKTALLDISWRKAMEITYSMYTGFQLRLIQY